MNYTVKKQYRYACTCGCNCVCFTFSRRKAERDSHGEFDEIFAVSLPAPHSDVVADCYSQEKAERVAAALSV